MKLRKLKHRTALHSGNLNRQSGYFMEQLQYFMETEIAEMKTSIRNILDTGVSHRSLGIDVFLNLLIVTDTSWSKSQPRKLSGFFGAA